MSSAEQRRELRGRRRALRQQLAALRRQARARLEQLPAVRKARARRRLRRGLLASAVLALVLLLRCDCAEPPVPVVPPQVSRPAADAGVAPKVARVVPDRPGPLHGTVPAQPRGKYAAQPRNPPSWLEDFHLQVAARSPRLAECFTGTDRPGALRWAAALNARSGAVSDHELEPLGAATSFSAAQRDCVVGVLSVPPYRLKLAEAQPLPNRVGLVIEF